MKQRVLLSILFIFSFLSLAFAQEKENLAKMGLGLEYGNWKPGTLDDNPGNPFKNVRGAAPYCGLTFVTPSFKNYSLRFSILQWQQKHLGDRTNKESVTLRHFSAEIKNLIIAESKIVPYVSYGISAIWSREVPVGSEREKIPLDRAGYGVNVGAGVDLQVLEHWAIAAEYQYMYAKFTKKVGLTDNYSGPKISFKVMCLF